MHTRSAFEIFRRDTGEGNAAHLKACRFPYLARNAKHGALSRSGIADDNPEIAPIRDMR